MRQQFFEALEKTNIPTPSRVEIYSLDEQSPKCIVAFYKDYETAEILYYRRCSLRLETVVWLKVVVEMAGGLTPCGQPSLIGTLGVSTSSNLATTMISTTQKPGMSPFAIEAFEAIFNRMGTTYLFQANRDLDFPTLFVKPDITPARLNKVDIIGNPVGYLDETISIPRRAALIAALEKPSIPYLLIRHFEDSLGKWIFEEEYRVVAGGTEVEMIVRDKDPWQSGFWEKGVAVGKYQPVAAMFG